MFRSEYQEVVHRVRQMRSQIEIVFYCAHTIRQYPMKDVASVWSYVAVTLSLNGLMLAALYPPPARSRWSLAEEEGLASTFN